MYAVEFNAPIHNGVVQIPLEYKELYEQQMAKFFVMIDGQQANNTITPKSDNGQELDVLLSKISSSLSPDVKLKNYDELRFDIMQERF